MIGHRVRMLRGVLGEDVEIPIKARIEKPFFVAGHVSGVVDR